MKLTIDGQHLEMTAERAVFWEEEKALILSDTHFGKGGHFRKAGIAVPNQVQDRDLAQLEFLVSRFQPKELIIVGDMFHSHANRELEKFAVWRSRFSSLRIILVEGNHDILPKEFYQKNKINLEQDGWQKEPFSFAHHPPEKNNGRFTFSGHLHPGVLVNGGGGRKLRLPCYWFSNNCVVLPAFSQFTGLYIIEPKPGDKIVAVVEDELIALNNF
ncbi:MAG: ligase-associated DNA damage response endonuclease PdeM [Bacteroidota bacterium]